jgi:carbon starvation protein
VIDHEMATAFVAVVVVSFALTTLDSATRLLRFNISEIGETLGVSALGNRYVASALAVGVIGWFAFYEIGGKPAGLALWTLFGTINQLLAGLALLTVTLYLKQRGRNPWLTGIPMVFMLGSTIIAMISNLGDFWEQRDQGTGPLFAVGSILLVMAVWLVVEAALAFRRGRGQAPIESLRIDFDPD